MRRESLPAGQLPVPAPLAPLGATGRMVELDLLRGVALLGILPMNIMAFAMPAAAYFNPTLYGDLTGANLWIWALTHLLAAEKLMTIFSMLFGAGILLMADRATASGRRAGALHIRRMFWLIVFGLMHAYLLWFGDVLVWYGALRTPRLSAPRPQAGPPCRIGDSVACHCVGIHAAGRD